MASKMVVARVDLKDVTLVEMWVVESAVVMAKVRATMMVVEKGERLALC